MERDLYGLHLPLRRLMERKIVADVRFSPLSRNCLFI